MRTDVARVYAGSNPVGPPMTPVAMFAAGVFCCLELSKKRREMHPLIMQLLAGLLALWVGRWWKSGWKYDGWIIVLLVSVILNSIPILVGYWLGRHLADYASSSDDQDVSTVSS